jgi:hypothetical protein
MRNLSAVIGACWIGGSWCADGEKDLTTLPWLWYMDGRVVVVLFGVWRVGVDHVVKVILVRCGGLFAFLSSLVLLDQRGVARVLSLDTQVRLDQLGPSSATISASPRLSSLLGQST